MRELPVPIDSRDSARKSPAAYRLGMAMLLTGFVGLSIGLIFCSLSYDGGLTKEELGGDSGWFNGDALYPAHLIEDVVIEGNTLRGWLLPPAPFLVPDFPCAMIARLVTPQPALGMFLTGALLFSLVALSAVYAARITSRETAMIPLFMTIATMLVAGGIAWGGSGTRLRFLFLPAYHTGTFALAILLTALGIKLAVDDGQKRRVCLGLFIAIGFVAGFSDLMTIAYVSAPLIVAVCVGWTLKIVPLRRAAIVSGSILASPLLGFICCTRLLPVHSVSECGKISIETISKCGSLFFGGFFSELIGLRPLVVLSVLWILCCWVAAFVWIRSDRKGESHGNGDEISHVVLRRKILLALCLSFAGPAVIGSLVVGGNYMLLNDGYVHIFRYLQPLIYAPLFFWPILIPDSVFAKIRRLCPPRIGIGIGVAAAGGLAGLVFCVGIGPHPLHSYVPTYIQTLDQIAQERGLSQGVGFYWTARDVNMFSQTGLRVIPILPDARHMHWMNSRQWVSGPFDEGALRPRPEFVLLSPTGIAARDVIVKQFGEPAEEIPLDPDSPARVVLIYNRPEDVALHNLFVNPRLVWPAGFYPPESQGHNHAKKWRWCAQRGEMVLHNPTQEPMTVQVEFECATALPESAVLTLESPLIQEVLSLNHLGTRFSKTLMLPPGDHAVSFSTDAKALHNPADPRELVFQVRDFRIEKLSGEKTPRVASKRE